MQTFRIVLSIRLAVTADTFHTRMHWSINIHCRLELGSLRGSWETARAARGKCHHQENETVRTFMEIIESQEGGRKRGIERTHEIEQWMPIIECDVLSTAF